MMSIGRTWFVFAVACSFLAAVSFAQTLPPPKQGTSAPTQTTIRGTIVKVEGPDRFIVRTPEKKDVVLYAQPQTRYMMGDKAGRFADLRVGAEINAGYVLRGDRYLVDSVTVGKVPGTATAVETPQPVSLAQTVRGKVMHIRAPDNFTVKTAEGSEVLLFATPQSRFMMNGQAVQFADLRIGSDVTATFRCVVDSVTLDASIPNTQPSSAEGTVLEGVVVRTIGEDQVVVRTADQKEVTVYVVPQTTYTFNDQPARFADFRTGADVRVHYDLRDRRNVARSVTGIHRKK